MANAPIKTFSVGGCVKVSVFEQSGPYGNFLTMNVQAYYKDKESGEYKYTNSLKYDQLPHAGEAIDFAYEYMTRYRNDRSGKSRRDDSGSEALVDVALQTPAEAPPKPESEKAAPKPKGRAKPEDKAPDSYV